MTRQCAGKTAVVVGAGNIGRGFVGAAFAASGYETVFIDIDENIVRLLCERGFYPVRLLENEGEPTETAVRGVRAVNAADIGAAAEEIARADICATAVGARAAAYRAHARGGPRKAGARGCRAAQHHRLRKPLGRRREAARGSAAGIAGGACPFVG
ncbi:MAG: hypothetical protein LBS91_00710 [Clostridiales Family XIII bacterium]|nr:hypothetical protein [Clostridiales Family XIII bacterium]